MWRGSIALLLVTCLVVFGCAQDEKGDSTPVGPRDVTNGYGTMPHPDTERLTLEEEFELYRRAIESVLQRPADYGLTHVDVHELLSAFPQRGSKPRAEAETLTDAEIYWLNREAYVTAVGGDPNLLPPRHFVITQQDPSCGRALCRPVSANVRKCRNNCASWWQISLSLNPSHDICIRTDGYPMECPN